MTIEIKKNVDELVLEITGRVDTITAPTLDKTSSSTFFLISIVIYYLLKFSLS